MAETLALLAALSFALGTTLQQRGTLATDAAEADPRFLVQIVREPVLARRVVAGVRMDPSGSSTRPV